MSENFVIAILDGNGQIKSSQPLNEFMTGPRSLEILVPYAGRKLFDILVDDLGIIRYEDNKFVLKTILEINPSVTTMRLLGKIAEAVIVRKCHNDIELNRKWFSIARKKEAKLKTANKFAAYGTGLLDTKAKYPQKYSASDPQRDVIWINETGQVALMNGSNSNAGLHAGIQIKVSSNGSTYFLNDLINVRYEVPVVYFDICNDFDKIASKLYYRGYPEIGIDFIKASAVDYEAYLEVILYVDLLMALIMGKMTPDQLIDQAEMQSNASMKNAIMSASFEGIQIPTIIIR